MNNGAGVLVFVELFSSVVYLCLSLFLAYIYFALLHLLFPLLVYQFFLFFVICSVSVMCLTFLVSKIFIHLKDFGRSLSIEMGPNMVINNPATGLQTRSFRFLEYFLIINSGNMTLSLKL